MSRFVYKKMLLISILLTVTLLLNNNVNAYPWDSLLQYQYIETDEPEMLDSLSNLTRTPIQLSCLTRLYDSVLHPVYGSMMWHDTNVKRLANDSSKYQNKLVNCFENGYINFEYQFDATNMTEDYCTNTSCIGDQCNSLWQQEIEISVINNNQIIINSSNDVFVEIYKAFHVGDSYIARFLVAGNNMDYIYNFNLEVDVIYIVVFRNIENDVVNIKKIWRQ
ncbi:MAG: hypothetical protein WCZ17_03020 [Candidatus Kapaibacterium sp.]